MHRLHDGNGKQTYGYCLSARVLGAAEATTTLTGGFANTTLAGIQLATREGVLAERGGGGNGGERSNQDEFELHDDGVAVVMG